MAEPLADLLDDCGSGLPATARVILLYLAQSPGGARVEEIARRTGSKYRWTEATASRLARAGLLRRVGPNVYSINPDREARK